MRLGVDFGTSTTQVAVYVEGRQPQLLRLESSTDHMPSYFALDTTGAPRFGAAAQNLPGSVHSIKPQLVEDAEIEGVGHPSRVAFQMLEEVVRRTLEALKSQGQIPDDVTRLEIETNLGCTPRFELDARVRLRDVARRAGLSVGLPELIEEPVAAAYEVMLSGLVTDGRVLIVDMGGGTLDTAVLKVSGIGQTFELFASGGTTNAGDRFTEILRDEIERQVAEHAPDADLGRADHSLIWQRAEAAKQSLSQRRSTVVALGGIAGIENESVTLTREWFHEATRRLRVMVEHDVLNTYRVARLVLDRGGKFDPAPGTVDFDEPRKGQVRTLGQIRLRDDGNEHLDWVVLVGGGTNMPMIAELFRSIFGDKVLETEIVGIDRSAIVALGLSRPKPTEMSNLRFPSWGVSAIFATPDGTTEVPLYEPYAPTFQVRDNKTAEYHHSVTVPASATSVALAFRPVGPGTGTVWPHEWVSPGTQLEYSMTLFGHVSVRAGGRKLYADRGTTLRAPWSPAEADGLADWLPPWKESRRWWEDMPEWDLRNDK